MADTPLAITADEIVIYCIHSHIYIIGIYKNMGLKKSELCIDYTFWMVRYNNK